MQELSGKRAIVTGGTRGIGLATVRQLAEAGAEVAFTGTSQAGVDAALAQLGDLAVTGHVCDVRDAQGMRTLLASGCDILVNNAALAEPNGLLHEVDDAELRTLLEVTLIAAIEWARHAAARMAASGGGTIVNLSSGAALRPVPNMLPYCIAKAGLAMASKGLHAELAERGVRVFSFGPGVVDTDMQTAARESGLFGDILPTDRSQLLPPDAPAKVIRWLCSHGDGFAGIDLSIRDEELQQAMASEPLPG